MKAGRSALRGGGGGRKCRREGARSGAAGPIMQRPVLKLQLGAAGRRESGDRAGTRGHLCAGLGRSPGSCSAGPQPSPGISSPSQSVAKQSLFCSERCLRFFHASQAFFLETPVPESSGYVKTCLHLKQKSFSAL
ncbi:hypothetical protein Nmel_016792 [Mimus melanotis]